MAENVGTITVAIEAQTAELQAGLEQAERAVKQSAQQMEASQEQLGDRVEKSWTEFASKLGVVMQVAQIAQQAVTALGEAAVIWGNESASAMDKYNSTLDALQNSGIPVLSQAISIGTTLRSWIDGSAADLARLNEEIERMNRVLDEATKQLAGALSAHALKDMADRWEDMTDIMRRSSSHTQDRLIARQMEFAIAREDLEKSLQEKITAGKRESDRELARESMARILIQFDKQTKFKLSQIKKQHDAEVKANTDAENAWGDRFLAEKRRERERLQMIENRGAAEEQATLKKTADLQTQLDIMTAQDAGDEEGAKMIALESKFEKMREQVRATADEQSKLNEIEKTFLELKRKALREGEEQYHQVKKREEAEKARARRETEEAEKQLELIDKIEAKEKARLSKSGEATDGGDATTSVSTAIGSFTVAMAGDPVQKEQTTLLERIANSNAKIADMQEKEKNVKDGVPTRDTKIVEATKEKETEIVEKKATSFDWEVQKIANAYNYAIKQVEEKMSELGEVQGQSEEAKVKRAELDAKRGALIEERNAKRSALREQERLGRIAKRGAIDPSGHKQVEAATPQAVAVGRVERTKEQQEQTTLLKKIAESNEKVADALSKKSNDSIIVPS